MTLNYIYITQGWPLQPAFCIMLLVMYMKNNRVKAFIFVIALVGYACIFIGVKQTNASVILTFILCWTAFILGSLFAFSPEIKRLIFRKDRVELDRFEQKVDQALVQYNEFKEAIYPLLKITLGDVAAEPFFDAGAKPEVLKDFVEGAETIAKSQEQDDLLPLVKGAKIAVLDAYKKKLNTLSNGLVDNCINTGIVAYTNENYADTSKIFVDEQELKQVESNIKDLANRRMFKNTVKELMNFYKSNF